jgi:hypothetical protein
VKKKQDPDDPRHITDPLAAISLGIKARAAANRKLKQEHDVGVRPDERGILFRSKRNDPNKS